MYRYIVLLLIVVISISITLSSDCVHRDYGNGGTVCVCNNTYCDTVEPVPYLYPRYYVYYTSSKDGLRFNLTKKNFSAKKKTRVAAQIVINTNVTYQSIHGFGGAFTDSAGINILGLSEQAQEYLLSSYYSDDGIEYNIGRVPIAGCDFSTRTYTYADEPDDPNLVKFGLAEEDYLYKIPLMQRAMNMSQKEIKFVSAAWSAPPWMKTNNGYTGIGYLKEEYYRAWADYHIKFLDEYKKHNITFWAMSTGNEPINGVIPFVSFNSLGWTPASQQQWIVEQLGPMLRNSTHSDLKLLILDDQRFFLPWWPSLLLENPEAAKYVDGIAVHWYWDTIVPASLLDMTHDYFPDKFLLATEASLGDKPWDKNKTLIGSWSRGEMYADDIIGDMNHWVSGWIDWNLALNPEGGPNWAQNFVDSAILVNDTIDEFYKQPIYYMIGHFSKFVPEGSVRVDIQPQADRVKTTAFKTLDSTVVIVLLNKRSTDEAITISGPPRGVINMVVPKRSIVTILYKDKEVPLHKRQLLEQEKS